MTRDAMAAKQSKGKAKGFSILLVIFLPLLTNGKSSSDTTAFHTQALTFFSLSVCQIQFT